MTNVSFNHKRDYITTTNTHSLHTCLMDLNDLPVTCADTNALRVFCVEGTTGCLGGWLLNTWGGFLWETRYGFFFIATGGGK
jgi:hypothetical protein